MGFAWKELLHEKKKYLLIELVIILLMFMVLFLSGLVEGLSRSIISGIADMDADYFLLGDSSGKIITNSEIDQDTFRKLQTQTNSELAPLNIRRMFLSKQEDEEKLDVTYFVIEPGCFLEPDVWKGVQLSETEAQNPIILNDSYLSEGIQLGDAVYDSSSGLEFQVIGFVKDKMYGHTSVGYISFDCYHKINTLLNPAYQTVYHTVVLKGKDIGGIDLDGTLLISKSETVEHIPSYSIINLTITAIEWVLMAITAAIIGVFYYILTIQKRKQFGVMKAVGMGMGRITAIVAGQVGIVSAIGVILANLFTVAVSAALPATIPFYFKIENFCLVSFAFVLICIASSLASVWHISRVDPMKAIGGGEE